MPRVPLGYQQLRNITSSTGLTVPSGSKSVDLIAEVANVRWRDDGVAPTTTVGALLVTDTTQPVPFTYFGNLSKLRFIAAAAGAILNAMFYKT